jgi:hypothetical protein
LRCSCNMSMWEFVNANKRHFPCNQSSCRDWNAWPLKYKTKHLDNWRRQWTKLTTPGFF